MKKIRIIVSESLIETFNDDDCVKNAIEYLENLDFLENYEERILENKIDWLSSKFKLVSHEDLKGKTLKEYCKDNFVTVEECLNNAEEECLNNADKILNWEKDFDERFALMDDMDQDRNLHQEVKDYFKKLIN